jgi:methylmalonyl-CoA mutase C-terminal domain/subunit
LDEVLVVGGGIIPDEDVPGLKDSGVAAIFGPGTRTEDIVEFIEEKVSRN